LEVRAFSQNPSYAKEVLQMKKKKVLLALFLMAMLIALLGCSPSPQPSAPPAATATAEPAAPTDLPADPVPSPENGAAASPEAQGELLLTLEELAAYDGKEGRPAYVAVDGIIYDMTDSARWRGGQHNGFTAGKDLTQEINNISPHGVSVLSRMPVVGKIVD
jgi:predicted heme/steroid binding protein